MWPRVLVKPGSSESVPNQFLPIPFRRWAARLGLVCLILIGTLVLDSAVLAPPVGADWIVPIQAPVVDPFRPPESRYGRGNRGLEYGDAEGLDVVAVDSGRVVFTGMVGRHRHVVVAHGSGLRSTYAYLQSSSVVRGQSVRRGQIVGRAAAGFHLTARLGDVYVDPALLFAGAEVVLQLTESSPPLVVGSGAGSGLLVGSGLGGGAIFGPNNSGSPISLASITTTWGSVQSLRSVELMQESAWAASAWYRLNCSDVGGPGRGGDLGGFSEAGADRILIQVGGLGSQDSDASIGALDIQSLGYSPDDIAGFSYAGGCTPEPFGLGPPLPNSLTVDLDLGATYDPEHTYQGVETSATRLADLIEATARSRPDQPIDIAAHSLGGVITRRALEILDDRRTAGSLAPGAMPSVVLTVGSPHGGAPLADGAIIVSDRAAGESIPSATPDWLDSPVVREISANGPDRLDPPSQPPEGVRVVAVAGDVDTIVPAPSAIWPEAVNVLVQTRPGASASHGDLPAHPDVAIEFGLALSGQSPRCVALSNVLAGVISGTAVSMVEQGVNTVISIGRWLL